MNRHPILPRSGQLVKATAPKAFSLMETLVSFAMLVILLLAVLVIFERSARIGRDQADVAAIQQSSRIAHSELIRHIRMAGAGGLPLTWKYLPKPATPAADTAIKWDSPGAFPTGFAVSIRTGITTEQFELPGDDSGGDHITVPGSDVLTLRGAFSLPVYYYHPAVQSGSWGLAPATKIDERKLEIPNRMGSDFRTSIKPLIDHLTKAQADDRDVLFIVRDLMNPDAYGVLKWASGSGDNRLSVEDCAMNSQISGTQDGFTVGCIVVAVEFDPAERYAMLGLGSSLAPNAGSPSFAMPASPTGSVTFPHQFGSIAVLQEYRYYVRAEFEIPGDNTSRMSPILTRTEYFPSMQEIPEREDFIETVDVVDNIIDLQIAAGIDQDWSISAADHGIVTEFVVEGATDQRNEDEILFNHPDDMGEPPLGLTRFDGMGYDKYIRWFHPKLDVYFLRLTTISQSQRPEREFVGAGLGQIEDCDRGVGFTVDGKNVNYNEDRKYRRRILQSVAELRNLK